MDKIIYKIFTIFLINVLCVKGISLKFTNITCESKDASYCTVDYCYIKQVSRMENYMSLRYALLQSVHKDMNFQLKVMTYRNGWKPYLYAIDIDICRYFKSQYNAIAKMVFGFFEKHTNMNHTCPYTKDKFATIDHVTNTDVNKNLRGLPFTKGNYALFTKFLHRNVTRAETNIFFEVLST